MTDREFAVILKTIDMLERKEIGFKEMDITEAAMAGTTLPREKEFVTEIYLADRTDITNSTNSHSSAEEILKNQDLAVTLVMYPDIRKGLVRWRECLTGVSALKILAALGAYHAERKAYPDNLGTLVPDYLNQLPRDYFSEGGKFHYTHADGTFTLASSSPDLKVIDVEGDLVHYPRPSRASLAKPEN